MNPFVMSAMLVFFLVLFAWSAAKRWVLATRGPSEPRFGISGGDLGHRIDDTLVYAFGQKKMPYYKSAGIAHMFIFGAFMVLLLRVIMLWARGYDEDFDFFGVLSLQNPIGIGYNILKDFVGTACVLGTAVFFYYRLIPKPKRMSHSGEAFLILGIIAVMMIGDMIYDGASLVLHHQAEGEAGVHWLAIEPVGSMWAILFAKMGLSESALNILLQAGFWAHGALPLIFLNILPYSKHFHVITAIPNVFARNLHPEALPPIEDLEGKVEREEPIGFVKITDLSWKDVMDLYTCTECGRCSDNCPAYTTGKKLSPKHVTLALRDHLYACEPTLIYEGTSSENPEKPAGEVHTHELHHGDPPKDAYNVPDQIVDLVPNVIDPDVIWACTSCRACEEQCPVMISYVDKFVQMRRDAVMIKNEFPHELMNPFNGIETNGNPWNMSAMDRASWTDGLDVPFLTDKPDAQVLYWVGCAASYDDRAKKIARATVKLFQEAGVDFAVLGTEESCTGDPARRAGNEYLFQTVAEANVETLNGYNADKKQIVTTCPHCFNTLANEYPDFGGKYDVVHHATFLEDLLKDGKLKPTKKLDKGGDIVFHDSCYLGRYNEVYDAPRNVLSAIPGVKLREPEYWTRNRGLCCGAGGAQMFMEEQNENRVNVKRTLQLLDTGAKTIASGCPFCMTMLTDGLKAQEKEDEIRQLDIAELLVEAIEIKEKAEAAE